MTYQEALAYIYGLGRFGVRPGLDNIKRMLASLGNPQERLQVVHVGGTNGKGSTAAFLSAILSASGCRTGLFTSPHLISFTERIRINGVEITESEVISLAERVIAAAPEGATFFEIVTAMAYLHFAESGVEAAVMEVGMGGRLDATNAATGILSIITPVSLDHTEYLGSTLLEIAHEKGGIIKAGRPLVLSAQPDEAGRLLEALCKGLGSPICRFGRDFSASWEEGGLSYRGIRCNLERLKPGVHGRYQAANAATAMAAAEILSESGFCIDEAAIRLGIETASWPGRMEMFDQVLLDGAHNRAGGLALAEALADIPRKRLFLVTGVMGDKDLEGILSPLIPLADAVFAVAPALPRALPSVELAAFCLSMGARAVDAGSVASGLNLAREAALPGDLIVVSGSLFTVGEARAFILSRNFEPFRG